MRADDRKPDDRKPWRDAVQGVYRKPASVVRTIVCLPPSVPDQEPAPLEDWEAEFWHGLFQRMTHEEQQEFLKSKGNADSKKEFLMRHAGLSK